MAKDTCQPRIKTDVYAVLKRLAAKNGRSIPTELDFILRPILFKRGHNDAGETPSIVEELDGFSQVAATRGTTVARIGPATMEGDIPLRLNWNPRKKQYEAKRKAKR